MSDPTAPTRREFLRSTTVAAVAGGLGCFWQRSDIEGLVSELTGLLDSSDVVRRLGTEYLWRNPDEGDMTALGAKMADDLRRRSPSVGGDRITATLHGLVDADFASGHTERYGGWVLSRTELRLYALSELAVRDRDPHAPEGVFPLEPAGSGADRSHWTTGASVLHVPRTSPVLILRLRSGAPFEQRVTVRLDRDLVEEIALSDSVWHRFDYPMPCHTAGHPAMHPADPDDQQAGCGRSPNGHYRVELETLPIWRPRNDFRSLGVQLGYPWTA